MYVACMEEKECYSTPYIHHLFLDVFKNVVIMVLKSFFIYFQLMYSKVNLLSSSTTILDVAILIQKNVVIMILKFLQYLILISAFLSKIYR
jgi:hypothetical protein